jgi:NADH-quinone oxidoreductase subunit M
MHGPIVNEKIRSFRDLTAREIAVAIPIVVLIIWMGLFPGMFLGKVEATVAEYIRNLKGRSTVFVQKTAVPAERSMAGEGSR